MAMRVLRRPCAAPTSLNGVDTAVDVEDLACGHGEEVAEEGDAAAGDDFGVVDVPAQGSALGPGVLEGGEAGDGLGRHGADGAGGDEIDPDALGPSSLAR